MPRISYFVHDVNDAAVARRVVMMHAAGAIVHVIGFTRDERDPDAIDGAQVTIVGRTRDAAMVQRAVAVVKNLLLARTIRDAARNSDVVMGRNLEGLALAWRVRGGRPGRRMIYECLDIHRMLLGRNLASRVIQRIEAALIRQADLLVTSSPAFLREYFSRYGMALPPSLLLENKVLALNGPAQEVREPAVGPPWTIGWFGNLRCRRSFEILTRLAAGMNGKVKVLFAGRPSPAVFEDFAGQALSAPHCEFRGSYTAEDLSGLYGECHFAWSIDFYEEGLNSIWLLPNRIYEAAAHGAVPIALDQVETGRWLSARKAGVVIAGDSEMEMRKILRELDAEAYAALRQAVRHIPQDAVIADRSDCVALMRAIEGRSGTS